MTRRKFDRNGEPISVANVGKRTVRVPGSELTGSVVRRGVLDGSNPGASVVTKGWDPSHSQVLFSEGFSSQWVWTDIRKEKGKSARLSATRLLNQYSNSEDDAPVLVETQTND